MSMKADWRHDIAHDLRKRVYGGYLARRDAMQMLAILGLGGATQAFAAAPRRQVLRIACSILEMDDPSVGNYFEAANVFRNVLDYLVHIDADSIVRPSLAAHWSASDDLRCWSFVLREDVTWSNGDRFDTRDVAATFAHWLGPNSLSVNKTTFASVRHIEITGPYAFRLFLDRPMVSLPEMLYGITCPMLHRSFPISGQPWSANPIGTGPYTLTAFYVDDEARLERRAGYWGTAPGPDVLRFIDLGQTPSTQLAALADGQVDILYQIGEADLPLARSLPGIRIIETVAAQTCCIRTRVDQKPFDDPRIRRAIQLASDNTAMLRLGYGGAGIIGANCHVAPFQRDYGPVPPAQRDVRQARHLLAQAGYADGIELTLALGNTQGLWEQNTAQIMQQSVAEAGIRINLNILPASEYKAIWSKIPFGLTYWTQRPLGMIQLDLAYRSGAAWNETRMADPAFDAALDIAMSTVDPQRCREAMTKAERILQNNAVIVQPFWQKKFTAVSSRVANYRLDPGDCFDFTRVVLS